MSLRRRCAVPLVVALAGCQSATDTIAPDADLSTSRRGSARSGAVITMSNAVAGNVAIIFPRAADGILGAPNEVPTGGTGTGGGLGNQGAIVSDERGRFVYLVNAGSNSIAVLARDGASLTRVETVGSGGLLPISLALRGNLLYALNNGSPANITGFWVDHRSGRLTPIPGSTRSLSTAAPAAAQVGFDPTGRVLVVTEKATDKILVFPVDDDRPGVPTIEPSVGKTPFGFEFSRDGALFVSEAFGGAADASAVSGYRVRRDGLRVVSPSVATTETAACWIVVTRNGRFVYTSNTASGSISGYRVRGLGRLELLDSDGVTGSTGAGSGPIDMSLTRFGREILYSLNSGNGTISAFAVREGGGLESLSTTSGLPSGANGLLAF